MKKSMLVLTLCSTFTLTGCPPLPGTARVVTPPPFGDVPPPANALNVEIRIDELAAATVTEDSFGNTRDEVYVAVAGLTPEGSHADRLPHSHFGDDYYQFHSGASTTAKGWTNQDEVDVFPPQLWTGVLQDGAQVSLLVHIGEQDNKDLQVIAKIVAGAAKAAAAAPVDPWIKAGLSALAGAASAVPTTNRDDMIATFAVLARNNAGALEVEWEPIVDGVAQIENASNSLVAGFTATSPTVNTARYTFRASVNVLPSVAPRAPTYAGTEEDRCGRKLVRVVGVPVGREQTRDVPLTLDADGRFRWTCETGSDVASERTRVSSGKRDATHMKVRRRGSDITWILFRP